LGDYVFFRLTLAKLCNRETLRGVRASISWPTFLDPDDSARNGIVEIEPSSIRWKVEMDHFRFAAPVVKLDPRHSPRGSHDDSRKCPCVQSRNCVVGHGQEFANPEWQEC